MFSKKESESDEINFVEYLRKIFEEMVILCTLDENKDNHC